MNRIHIKNSIVFIIVFIISFGAFHYNTAQEISNEEDLVRQRVEINVRTQASVIQQDISDAEEVAEIVRYCIDANHGKLADFAHLGLHLMSQNKAIMNIALAPQGIVTQSYSRSGYSKKKTNLNKDNKYRALLKYTQKQDSAVVAGPMSYQNKRVLILISPIHYPHNNKRTFYGYALCVMDLSAMFKRSIDAFDQWNYSYQLTKTDLNGNTYHKIAQSGTLKNAYTISFKEGHSTWRLSASRKANAVSDATVIRMHLGDLSLSLLLAFACYFLLYQRHQHKKLQQSMDKDYLTQIYNRQGFEKKAENYLKKHPKEDCVGILIDIDDFKYINDLYGHSIGDEVLKHLSARLVSELPENSIVGRNGGDEFSALIENTKGTDIEPILQKLTAEPVTFTYEGRHYHYAISLGYAQYPKQAKDLATLLRNADAALYVVKVKGKHGYQAYDPHTNNNERNKLGFKLQDVTTYLPGAFLIYRDEDGELLYMNKEMIHLMGCADYNDFMIFTHHNVKGIVHPDDYAEARDNIEKQIQEQNSQIKNVRLDYRVITKDGREILMHEVGREVESEYFGWIWYVIIGPRPVKKKA